MSLAAVLLAPLAMLLPAASPAGGVRVNEIGAEAVRASEVRAESEPAQMTTLPFEPIFPAFDPAGQMVFRLIAESFRAESQDQVRIEQRVTIRISPQPSPMMPTMLADLPQRAVGPRFAERSMGKCLPASGIAGVQAYGDNRLLLFMRDQRIVSAELERSCGARDFYSGFYVQRTGDGQICVKRDTLLSRNGANCKLSKLKQLVELGN